LACRLSGTSDVAVVAELTFRSPAGRRWVEPVETGVGKFERIDGMRLEREGAIL
jgi:hypothetical protein